MTHSKSSPGPPADNTPPVTLDFKEEPVGLPPSEGFGYLNVNIGDELGPDNRYLILRKLGYGLYSNVWLARDTSSTSTHQFVAIKILTTIATKGLHMDEHAFLERISQPAEYYEDGRDHCIILLDSFDITREDDSGTHHWHCLVTENRIIPLPMLKTALRHILHALSYLHIECDVIHTDIKADNIMTSAPHDDEITNYLNANPPQYHPTMDILGKYVRPIARQPIASLTSNPSFKLADYGHAQWYSNQITDDISPTALRAPENILHYYWDEKVDIWALGCLTFESLTGASLFDRKDDPQGRFSADDEHLLRMMQLTGQSFPTDMLTEARKGHLFFKPDGSLIRFRGDVVQRSVFDSVEAYKRVEDMDELRAAAKFMERCLQLRAGDRLSADELLLDPWLRAEDT